MSELDGSGQSTQKQGARVDYQIKWLRALCNRIQNTTVIRTSPATVEVSIEEAESIHPRWQYLPVCLRSSKAADQRLLNCRDHRIGWKTYPEFDVFRKRSQVDAMDLREFMVNKGINSPTLSQRILFRIVKINGTVHLGRQKTHRSRKLRCDGGR